MQPTLKLGAIGDAVALLHQQLLERGALPPEAAEEQLGHVYGPVTAGAVASFQAAQELVADGICGRHTWDALLVGVDAPDDVPPLVLAGLPPLVARALELADQAFRARVAEDPPGANRGPEVDRYLVGLDGAGKDLLRWRPRQGYPPFQGAPWCGRFARYVVDAAAHELGEASPLEGAGDLASAMKWFRWGRAQGRLHDEPAPGRAGLIIVPATEGREAHGHVVLVSCLDGQQLGTREGNSANRVAARWRPTTSFAGFVDLA